MEHSSDDAGITVDFYDETEHYLPGPRGGREIKQIFPQDSNREESSALFSEIRRSAEQVGAQVGRPRERKQERGERHFDAGLAWTITQTTLATFASAGGAWLFFEQCQSLLARWIGNKPSRWIRVVIKTNGELEVVIGDPNDLKQVLEALRPYIKEGKP